jgi:hypothetical protein
VRTSIIILILANLAFAAWALLIDQPEDGPPARDITHLPRLVLASEPVPAATSASAAKGGSGGAATARAAANAHCVTVGPFSDLAIAAAAASLLQDRGFAPIQRDEPGPDLIAYWVYLDSVPTDAAVARLLQKLHDNGVADARVMPVATPTETRRISVGLFNEQDGAERRVRQVKNLGLVPAIAEQHQSQATYWVDINLSSPGQGVNTEGLLPPPLANAHLDLRDCPAPASSAPPESSATASRL